MLLNEVTIGDALIYKREKGNLFQRLIYKAQLRADFSNEDAEYIHIEPIVMKTDKELITLNAKFPFIRLHDAITKQNGRYVKVIRPKFSGYCIEKDKVVIHWLTRINKIYGLGILWFLFRKFSKKNHLSKVGDFCSELYGYGIWRQFCDYLKIDVTDVLPKYYDQLFVADCLNKKYFEVIYEGYIK